MISRISVHIVLLETPALLLPGIQELFAFLEEAPQPMLLGGLIPAVLRLLCCARQVAVVVAAAAFPRPLTL